MTIWDQQTFSLAPRERGFHLVTHEVEAASAAMLERVRVGLAHVFLLHSSASLTLNENADPTVRADFERHFDRLAPENAPHYRHTLEGADDMPAHLKASLLGASVTIPVAAGRLVLGTWQGIYLCEHRDRGGRRRVTVTVCGEAN